jgi:hypothetical protein
MSVKLSKFMIIPSLNAGVEKRLKVLLTAYFVGVVALFVSTYFLEASIVTNSAAIHGSVTTTK